MTGGDDGIRFSPMSPDDLDWVLLHEVRLHAFPWTRGNFSDSLEAGYGCWVMRHHDEPVAYAVQLLVLDEAHLLNISVCVEAQRRGHARRLLDFLFLKARERGATQMFLEVRPSNLPALALYKKMAFQSIGRRARYYPAADGGREDAIVMRRDL